MDGHKTVRLQSQLKQKTGAAASVESSVTVFTATTQRGPTVRYTKGQFQMTDASSLSLDLISFLQGSCAVLIKHGFPVHPYITLQD